MLCVSVYINFLFRLLVTLQAIRKVVISKQKVFGRIETIGVMKMQALRSHMMQRVVVWVVALVTLDVVVVRWKEQLDDPGRQIEYCQGLEKATEGVERATEGVEETPETQVVVRGLKEH